MCVIYAFIVSSPILNFDRQAVVIQEQPTLSFVKIYSSSVTLSIDGIKNFFFQ